MISAIKLVLRQRLTLLKTPHDFSSWAGIIFLILGIYLRAYHANTYPFGFDQTQILENADRIISGDWTLIGPMTGPASMFTGPLIYYWCAGWRLFFNPFLAIIATALSIATVTGISLWFLARRYLASPVALMYVFFWAFSPYIISLDRIPWNPDFSLLSASLVFFPLLGYVDKKKLAASDYLFFALGIFLGYQAHFSGLLLPLLGLTSLVWNRTKAWLLVLVASVSWGMSLIPTLVFDLRNHWLNLRGLQGLMVEKVSYSDSHLQIVVRIWQNLLISIENLGKIVFYGNLPSVIMASGLMIGVSFWAFCSYSKRVKLWIGSTLVIFIIILAFYEGQRPEYYFLIQLPFLLLCTSSLFYAAKPKIYIPLLVLLGLYYWLWNRHTYVLGKPGYLTIENHQTMLEILKTGQSVQEVVLDMEPVNQFGFHYLFKQENILDPQGAKAHLVYPYEEGSKQVLRSGLTALWYDWRLENADMVQYLELKDRILQIPMGYRLLQDVYLQPQIGSWQSFGILHENRLTGYYHVFKRELLQKDYPDIYQFIEANDPDWQIVDISGHRGWFGFQTDRAIMMEAVNPEDESRVFALAREIQELKIR